MSVAVWRGNLGFVCCLLLAAAWMSGATAAEVEKSERAFGHDDDPNAPLELRISYTDGSADTGIALRVELENAGDKPLTLSVCDSMTLCCVKNLHPLIAYNDTQMGLQDLCKTAKPRSHEVFLPVNATFAFDAAIPPKWLPETVLAGRSPVRVQFCYEFEDGKTRHSNALKIRLR